NRSPFVVECPLIHPVPIVLHDADGPKPTAPFEVTMKHPAVSRAGATAFAVVVAAVVFLAAPAGAQDIPGIEKNVTVHTLPNGWTFIIYERPVAPVFSFATHVNVGSDREVPGITGLAHMFEHMAFKGTADIGTNDYEKEKVALDKVDQAYAAYDTERRRTGSDPEKLRKP